MKPGPISRGRFEKRARFATAFELIEESKDVSREIPSWVADGTIVPDIGAGASGSEGEGLYMMSYDSSVFLLSPTYVLCIIRHRNFPDQTHDQVLKLGTVQSSHQDRRDL